MICSHPYVKTLKTGLRVMLPCGHCMPCRIMRTRDWTIRCLMELKSFNDNACFITLTYDDEHLPVSGSLVKSDFQKFIKRLRKDLVKTKIKYFACGEYGDKNARPHYHAIIFGLSPTSETRQLLVDNWRFCDKTRFSGFDNGLAFVSANSIRYVTGYIQKKLNGELADKVYGDKVPPFQLCSQGLGKDYFLSHESELLEQGYLIYRNAKVNFPRYFYKKFELSNSTKREYGLLSMVDELKSKGVTDDEIKEFKSKQLLDSLYISMFDSELIQNDVNIKAKMALKGKIL